MPPSPTDQSNPKPGMKPKTPRKVGKKIDPVLDSSFTLPNSSLASDSRSVPQLLNTPTQVAKSSAASNSAPQSRKLQATKASFLNQANQSTPASTSSNLAENSSSAQPARPDPTRATSIQPVPKKRKRNVTPSPIAAPTQPDASSSKYYSQPTPHSTARDASYNQAPIAPSTPAPGASSDGLPPAKKPKPTPRSKLAASSTPSSQPAAQGPASNPAGEAVDSTQSPNPLLKKKKLKTLLGNSQFFPQSSGKSAQAALSGRESMPPGSLASSTTSGTSTPAKQTPRKRGKSITGLPLSTKPAPSMLASSLDPNTFSVSKTLEQPSKTTASSSLPTPPMGTVDWSKMSPEEILARYSRPVVTKARPKAPKKTTKAVIQNTQLHAEQQPAQPTEKAGTQSQPAGEGDQPMRTDDAPNHTSSTMASIHAPPSSGTAHATPDHQKKSKELKSAIKKTQPQAAESLPSATEATAQTTNHTSPPAIPTGKSAPSLSTPQIPEAPPKSKANKDPKKTVPVLGDVSNAAETTQNAHNQTSLSTQPEPSVPSLSAQQTFEATKKARGVKNSKKSDRNADEVLSTCQGTVNPNEITLPPNRTEPSAPLPSAQTTSEASKKVKAVKKLKKGTPVVLEGALRAEEIDNTNDTPAPNLPEQSGPSNLTQQTGEAVKQANVVKTPKKRTQSQSEANPSLPTEEPDQESTQGPDVVSKKKKASTSNLVSALQSSVSQETASPAKHTLKDKGLSAPADSTILTAKELKSRRQSQTGAKGPRRISSVAFTTEEYILPLDQEEAESAGNHEAATVTTASETANQGPTQPLPIDSLETLASGTLPPIMLQVLMEKAAKKPRHSTLKLGASTEVSNSGPTSSHATGAQTADETATDPLSVKDPSNLPLVTPSPQSQQVPAEEPSKKKHLSTVESGASKEGVNPASLSGHELPRSSHALEERVLHRPGQSGDVQVPAVVSKSKPHSKPSRNSKQNFEAQAAHASIQPEPSARDESEVDLLATSSEPSGSYQPQPANLLSKVTKKSLVAAGRVGQEGASDHLNQPPARGVADTSTLSSELQAQQPRDPTRSGGDGNDEPPVPMSEPKTAAASSEAEKKASTPAIQAGPEASQHDAGVSGKQQTLNCPEGTSQPSLPSAAEQPREAAKSGEERDGERHAQTSKKVSGMAGSPQVAQAKPSKKQKQKNLRLSHGNVEGQGTEASKRREVAGLEVVKEPQRDQAKVSQEHASTQVSHLKTTHASVPVLCSGATSRPALQAEQRVMGGLHQSDVGESPRPLIKGKKKKDRASAKMNQQNPTGITVSTAGPSTGSQSADKVAEPIHTQTSKKRKHKNLAPAKPNSTVLASQPNIDVDKDRVVEPAFKKAKISAQPMNKPIHADGSTCLPNKRQKPRRKERKVAVAPQTQMEPNESPHDGPPALSNASPTRAKLGRPVLPADGALPAPTPPQVEGKDPGAHESAQVATKTGPCMFGRWELSIGPDTNLPESVLGRLQVLLDEALRAGVAKPITGPPDIGSGAGSQAMANASGNNPSRAISQPVTSSRQPSSHNQSSDDFGRSAPQPAVDSGPPASQRLDDSAGPPPQPSPEPTLPPKPISKSIDPASQTKPIEKPRSGGSDESLGAQIRRLSKPLLNKSSSILNCIVSSEDESDNQRSEYVADESDSEPRLSRLKMLQQSYRRQSSSPEELSDESEPEDGAGVMAKSGLAARPVNQPPVARSSSHDSSDDNDSEDGRAVFGKTARAGRAIEQPSTPKSSSKEPSNESEPEGRFPVAIKAPVATQSSKLRSSSSSTSFEESSDHNQPGNRSHVSIKAPVTAQSAKRLSNTSSSSEESSDDDEHGDGLAGPAKNPMTDQRSFASCHIEPNDKIGPNDNLAGLAKATVAARPADQSLVKNSIPEEPSDVSKRTEGPVVSVASQSIKRPSITGSSSEDSSDGSEPDDGPSVSIKAPVASQFIRRPSITSSSSEDSSDESEPENVPAVAVKSPVAAKSARDSLSSSSSSEESSDESEPEDGPAGSKKICGPGGLTKQSSIRAPVAEANREESCESSLSVNDSAPHHIGLTQAKTTASLGHNGSDVRNAPYLPGTASPNATHPQDAWQLSECESAKKTNNGASKDAAPEKGLGDQSIQPVPQGYPTSDQAKQISLSELSDDSDDVQDVVMMALNLEQTEGYGLEPNSLKAGPGHLVKSCDATKHDTSKSGKTSVPSPLVAQAVVFTSGTHATPATSLLKQSKVLSKEGISAIDETILAPSAILNSASPIGNTSGETTKTVAPKERAEVSPTITSGQGVDDSDSQASHFSSKGKAENLANSRTSEALSAVQAEPDAGSSSDDETSSETNEDTSDDERPPTPGQKPREGRQKEKFAEGPELDSHIASGRQLASSQQLLPQSGSQRTAVDLHARPRAVRRKTLDHFRPLDFSVTSSQSLNNLTHSGSQHQNLGGAHDSDSDSSSSDEESSDGSSTEQGPSGGLPISKLAGADPRGLAKQQQQSHKRRKSAAEMWAKEEAKILNAKKLPGSQSQYR